jgi:hypothetical protein
MKAKIERIRDRIEGLRAIERMAIRYGESAIRREVLHHIKVSEGELRVLQTRTQQTIPIVV